MKKKTRFTRAEWVTVVLAVGLPVLVAHAALTDPVVMRAHKMKAISNLRQVMVALKIYASDHQGMYTDEGATSSNQAFRKLFVEGAVDSEKIFGCENSAFVADGNIGAAPDFKEAVKAGENHWAMTAGLSDSASGAIPFVYENPSKAEWPPKWNTKDTASTVKGRAWEDGTIVVGLNDMSAMAYKLKAETGTEVELGPKPQGGGEVFAKEESWKVLDVEVAAPPK